MSYMICFLSLWISFLFNSKSFWSWLSGLFILLVLLLKGLWIADNSVSSSYYSLSVDMMSFLLVILSILVMVWSWYSSDLGPRKSEAEGCMIGMLLVLVLIFSTRSLLNFFLLFEISLVPIYFMISYFSGQYERIFSNYYFLLYTIISSIPLFMIISFLSMKSCTNYNFMALCEEQGCVSVSAMVWMSVMLSFLSKLPVYSLHFWLPKAHVDAPLSSSMVLASVLLKLSSYGIMRTIFLVDSSLVVMFVMLWGAWGYFMSSLLCMRAVDFKVMVAFSSVSHMSICLSSIIILSGWSYWSSFYLMLGHSIISPMMFYLGSLLYAQTSTRSMVGIKGSSILWGMIWLVFILVFMFNFSFPPSINFWSELMVFCSVLCFFCTSSIMICMSFFVTGTYLLSIFVVMFGSKAIESWHASFVFKEYWIMLSSLLSYSLLTVLPSVWCESSLSKPMVFKTINTLDSWLMIKSY